MPFGNEVEERVGIRNTQAFIDAHYSEVKLRRPRTQRTEAGGVRKINPDLIPTQRVRIVPMSGLVWDRSRPTPDEGRVPDVTEMLICLPWANIQVDDYFDAPNGGWFEINHVSPVQGYRKECRLRWSPTEPRA